MYGHQYMRGRLKNVFGDIRPQPQGPGNATLFEDRVYADVMELWILR